MLELQSPDALHKILDSLRIGVLVADRTGKILFWNQGAEQIAGHVRHEVIGRSYRDNILQNCTGQSCSECVNACPFSRTLHEGKPSEVRMQIDHKRGHKVPVVMRVAAIRDSHGSVVATAASFEAQRWHPEVRRDQRRPVPNGCDDEITGTANRSFTEFHLRENLASFHQYHIPFGIICVRAVDVSHFRASYGQQAYDGMVRVLAVSLGNSFRPSDFVGRWAEDEFLVILTNCPSLGAERAFERVHRLIPGASIRWWGEQIVLAVDIGYAVAEPADSIESLLARARHFAALTAKTYRAKGAQG